LHKDLEERLRFCNTLPTLSTVAVRVIDLAGSPVTDLGEVARCINVDPALTTKILRVANSPLYGKRRKTENLRQALTLLGLNTTVTLALSFSLTASLRDKKQAVLDTTLYWRRSILAAVIARTLGEHLKVTRLEDLFLGGLLQDIGMLVLDSVMPDKYGPVVADIMNNHTQLIDAEREKLGTDHIEVGTWLLRHWELPEYLRLLVAASHDPTMLAEDADLSIMANCVAVSGLVADQWLYPNDNAVAERAYEGAIRWLAMDEATYRAIMDTVAATLPEVSALFEIEVLDTAQVTGILDKAKEILTIRNLLLLDEIVVAKRNAEALETRTRALEEQASTDSLTGLFNRGHLDEVLNSEFVHATEQGWPLSVAFIDLDHFKEVNDTYGHQAGDQVLQGVAGILTSSVRQSDIVARYGGEEFIVVLPGTGVKAACIVLERMLRALRSRSHTIETAEPVSVTGSIGLATHLDNGERFDGVTDLLRAADRALYTAKRGGRNQLVVYKTTE
jgi:diguanylate cyclase (GGDEF)-like protein